jgi:DNA helicase HerA-like ATPase
MKELLQKDSIFRVGKVVSVEGRTVKVEVDKTKNSAHILYNGDLLRNIAVNSYIKITKGFTKIIGKVEGEFIIEDKQFVDKEYKSEKQKIKRILQISLLGFFGKKDFERGIKELPLINNECFLLDRDEFEAVHDFVKSSDKPLTIGKLTHENIQPIRIGINDLFASHIGIFGNTGSGKSYTLAKIYNELFFEFNGSENFQNNARFLLFDFNGEYNSEKCITDNKKVYNLSTRKNDENKQKIPFKEDDLLNIDLFSIMANATEKTQRPFLKRALSFYKLVSNSDNPDEFFRNILRKNIKKVLRMADKEKGLLLLDYLEDILPKIKDENGIEIGLQDELNFHNKSKEFILEGTFLNSDPEAIEETEIYKRVSDISLSDNFIARINQFLYLQLISDVITNRAENKHISPAINKLKSFQKDIENVIEIVGNETDFWGDECFVVVNLDRTNVKIRKMIPLLLSYKLYSEHKELKDKKKKSKKSLNIIVDEAHNILSFMSERESETWKDYRLETFEEIIKEGRKFGVFLTIASQRPSDISATIISQLHNFFLHRLINNNDIKAVERTVSYLDKLSFESLPILPTGTCILAGLSAQVPVMIDIGEIPEENEPDNKTIKLTDFWYDN